MNYETANATLTGRCKQSRKMANHTYLERQGEDIALRLHATDVVTMHADGSITLNSGGWQTVTTKERINNYYHFISQKAGIWYMNDGSLFYDGVTIDPDGNVINPREVTDYELRLKALKKEIRNYSKDFAANVKGIAIPNNGDCWGCAFQVENNDPKNRTEPFGDGHYSEHFKDGYYVPSLLGNAILSKGYRDPGFIYNLCQSGTWHDTYAMLYKFLLKQLKPSLDREV